MDTTTGSEKAQRNSSGPSSSSGNGFVDIPNPLLSMRTKGLLDLMDEEDLKAHLPQEYAKSLIKTCNIMRSRKPDQDRLLPRVLAFNVDFNVSIKELMDFTGTTKERDVALTSGHPCFSMPFSSKTFEEFTKASMKSDPEGSAESDLDQDVIIIASNCYVEQNPFASLFKESLKMGSSISEDFLRAQRHFDPNNLIVQHYQRESKKGNLPFNVPLQKPYGPSARWPIMPRLADKELVIMSTDGLVEKESVTKGVIKVSYKQIREHVKKSHDGDNEEHDKAEFVYFPEEHGLTAVLKRHMPSVISSVRVYATQIGVNNSMTFLRLPYNCYLDTLVKSQEEFQIMKCREAKPRDIHFWVGYKNLGEYWEDENEKSALLALGEEELNKKRLIRINVTLCWNSLSRTQEDWFLSHKSTVGAWLPTACGYVDALMQMNTPATEGVQEQVIHKIIHAPSLPYYLTEHIDIRKKIKHDKPVEPKQTLTYVEKLIQL